MTCKPLVTALRILKHCKVLQEKSWTAEISSAALIRLSFQRKKYNQFDMYEVVACASIERRKAEQGCMDEDKIIM